MVDCGLQGEKGGGRKSFTVNFLPTLGSTFARITYSKPSKAFSRSTVTNTLCLSNYNTTTDYLRTAGT